MGATPTTRNDRTGLLSEDWRTFLEAADEKAWSILEGLKQALLGAVDGMAMVEDKVFQGKFPTARKWVENEVPKRADDTFYPIADAFAKQARNYLYAAILASLKDVVRGALAHNIAPPPPLPSQYDPELPLGNDPESVLGNPGAGAGPQLEDTMDFDDPGFNLDVPHERSGSPSQIPLGDGDTMPHMDAYEFLDWLRRAQAGEGRQPPSSPWSGSP